MSIQVLEAGSSILDAPQGVDLVTLFSGYYICKIMVVTVETLWLYFNHLSCMYMVYTS